MKIEVPKYNVDDVIDLRFSKDHMPDRICILMVYRKTGSKEWMYQVLSELNDSMIFMSESQINKRISRKNSKCYEHEIVKKMYESGYRFCGNAKSNTAFNRAERYKRSEYIRHIVLVRAIDPDGNMIEDELGLWVQYNNVIDSDHIANGKDEYYKIK